jgi:hypothetical protein
MPRTDRQSIASAVILSFLFGLCAVVPVVAVEAFLSLISFGSYVPRYWGWAFILGAGAGALHQGIVRYHRRHEDHESLRADLGENRGQSGPWQFRLRTLMTLTTLVCVAAALGRWLGLHGPVLVADGIVLALAWASACERTSLFGIEIPRITLGDFLALAMICLLLHALSIPPVTNRGRPRNTVAAPPAEVNAPIIGKHTP